MLIVKLNCGSQKWLADFWPPWQTGSRIGKSRDAAENIVFMTNEILSDSQMPMSMPPRLTT